MSKETKLTAEEYLKENNPTTKSFLEHHIMRGKMCSIMDNYAEHYHQEQMKEIMPSDEEHCIFQSKPNDTSCICANCGEHEQYHKRICRYNIARG